MNISAKTKVFLPLDFEYNDETDLRLIQTVKKFPQLYDKRLALFKSSVAKAEAWKKVAELSQTPLEFAIRRWDVLRRSYNKYRKSTSKDEMDSRPEYIKAMDFINEFILSRLTRKKARTLPCNSFNSNSNSSEADLNDLDNPSTSFSGFDIHDTKTGVKRKFDVSENDNDMTRDNNDAEIEVIEDKAEAMGKVLAYLLRDIKDNNLQNKKFLEAMVTITEPDEDD